MNISFGQRIPTATCNILDKKENKILLLSEFTLEQMPFHNEWEKITWEKCSLRNPHDC